MNKISHITIILAVLCCLASSMKAQMTGRDQVYGFLRIPASPEVVMTGGASVSYPTQNPLITFSNPGLYGQEMTNRLGISFLNYIPNAYSGAAIYGKPVGDRGAWAAGARFVQYGKMQGYNQNGEPTGSFSATDIALQGTFSYDLSDVFRGGVTLKGVYSHIETYSSFGVGVDVGVSYLNDEIGLILGAAATNIGVQIKGFHNEHERLPWDIQIGASQRLAHAPFRAHLLIHELNPRLWRDKREDLSGGERFTRHFAIGLEFIPNDKFSLGVGYNPAIGQDMKLQGGNKLGGFSIGAGLNTSIMDVNVGVSSFHPSQLSFSIGLVIPFGEAREEL